MEREAELTLRIIALILGVISVAFACATIGLIQHNQALVDEVEDATLPENGRGEADLLLTVFFTMSTASWIIFLAGWVAIGETISVILLLMRGRTVRIVLSKLLEIISRFIGAFCFLATGIVCAVLADEWSGPPRRCITDDTTDYGSTDYTTDDLDCRDVALTGTNTIQAIICFIQMAVFGIISILIFYTMTFRKATT